MTKVNFESVSITGGDHVYSVNGKVESITISAERAAKIGAELATLRERVAALEAIRDKWRVAFEKADFYIGCTIEDKELLAWQEYNEAKKALYSREGE